MDYKDIELLYEKIQTKHVENNQDYDKDDVYPRYYLVLEHKGFTYHLEATLFNSISDKYHLSNAVSIRVTDLNPYFKFRTYVTYANIESFKHIETFEELLAYALDEAVAFKNGKQKEQQEQLDREERFFEGLI